MSLLLNLKKKKKAKAPKAPQPAAPPPPPPPPTKKKAPAAAAVAAAATATAPKKRQERPAEKQTTTSTTSSFRAKFPRIDASSFAATLPAAAPAPQQPPKKQTTTTTTTKAAASSAAAAKIISTSTPAAEQERVMQRLHALLPLCLAEVYEIERLRGVQCATLQAFGVVDDTVLQREPQRLVVMAPTGSGKTLAYLLPLIELILRVAELRRAPGDAQTRRFGRLARDAGIFGVILAPTKELAAQVHDVLRALTQRRVPWLLPLLLCGGRSRKAEKASMRKGVHVLVATPGRLLDHLQQTQTLAAPDAAAAAGAAYPLAALRFLVLDECDRLLGAQQDEVVRAVELLSALRRQAAPAAFERGDPTHLVLASATATGDGGARGRDASNEPLQALVKRLMSGHAVTYVNDDEEDEAAAAAGGGGGGGGGGGDDDDALRSLPPQPVLTDVGGGGGALSSSLSSKPPPPPPTTTTPSTMTAITPAQLEHTYAVVHAKERLTALLALMRAHIVDEASASGKVMCFVATIREVEFLDVVARRFLLPMLGGGDARVTSLHGDMLLDVRRANASAFNASRRGLLVCTDVAARGLDFRRVTLVVQYDAPTDTDEYLHRAGRTARMQRDGRSLLLLREAERGFVELLATRVHRALRDVSEQVQKAQASVPFSHAQLSSSGVTAERALQIAIEQELVADEALLSLGKAAFAATARAYTSHARAHRPYFDLRQLHLGHLAASFALRDPPSALQDKRKRTQKREKNEAKRRKAAAAAAPASLASSRVAGASSSAPAKAAAATSMDEFAAF